MEMVCQNCEIDLQADFLHCPKCGQKTNLHRLTFHDVVHDAIHYFFHADKSLFTLIRELAKNGGKVAREFIEGKRKKYFPPLNFFLIVAAIYLFVQVKTDSPEIVDVLKTYPELSQIKDEARRQVLIEAYQRREHAIHFTNQHSNTVMMASLPIIAAIFFFYYRRFRYNYTEHLAAGMYMFGFFTLVYSVLDFLCHLFDMDGTSYVIYWIGQIIYFPIFYRGFAHGSRKRAFAAGLTASVTVFLINVIAFWIYMFLV